MNFFNTDRTPRMLSSAYGRELYVPAGICGLIGVFGFYLIEVTDASRPIGEKWTWWLRYFYATFVFVSAGLFRFGLVQSRALKRTEDLKRGHPSESWLWDFHWEGFRRPSESIREYRDGLLSTISMLAFLIPMSIFLVTSIEYSKQIIPLYAIMAVFDFIALWSVGIVLVRRKQLGMLARSGLSFEKTPFFLGESVNLKLEFDPRDAVELVDLQIYLTGVEESLVRFGNFHRATVIPRCEVRYKERLKFEQAFGASSSGCFCLEIKLPELSQSEVQSIRGSALSVRPPRYWDIEVRGKWRTREFVSRYLIPVYEKPICQ